MIHVPRGPRPASVPHTMRAPVLISIVVAGILGLVGLFAGKDIWNAMSFEKLSTEKLVLQNTLYSGFVVNLRH